MSDLPSLAPSRAIISSIRSRDLYKCVWSQQINFSANEFWNMTVHEIREGIYKKYLRIIREQVGADDIRSRKEKEREAFELGLIPSSLGSTSLCQGTGGGIRDYDFGFDDEGMPYQRPPLGYDDADGDNAKDGLELDDIIVEKRFIHHGRKDLNPVDNMR